MRISTLTTAVIVAYALGSLVYVYRWRGTIRYASFKLYDVCKFSLNIALLVVLMLILLAVPLTLLTVLRG